MLNQYSGIQIFITVNGQLYTAEDLKIESMRVVDDDEGDNSIELTMVDEDYRIADSVLFKTGELLSIKWGFVGGQQSDERSNYVIMKPETTYDSDGVVSTFSASTKSATLAARHPQKTSGPTSVKSVISEIANRNGLTLDITGGNERLSGFAHGAWSDRQVIRILADRFGYQASFSSETITFAPRDYGQVPSIELIYNRGEDGTVISAQLSVDAAKSLGDHKTSAVSVDPSSKTIKQGDSQPAEKTLAISAEDGHSWASVSSAVGSLVSGRSLSKSGSQVVSAAPPAVQQDIARIMSSPDTENLQSLATGENLVKQKKKGEFSVTSIGFVKAKSRAIITAKGFAKRDSGNWYVISVEHNISKDGYTCKWELARHGNNSKGGEKNTEPLNAQTPPRSGYDSVKSAIAINAETGKVTK